MIPRVVARGLLTPSATQSNSIHKLSRYLPIMTKTSMVSRSASGQRQVARRGWRALLASEAVILVLLAGCQRASDPAFVSSTQVEELDEPLQVAVRQELQKWCGTPTAPKMLGGESELDSERLKRGARVYERNCQQCHGVSGDGNGQAAMYLVPRPRDYRRGIFKFVSTGYGNKPHREDLLRTITKGIAGTSMPSFRRLPKHDLEAVIDYVLTLTQRGELELLLAAHAESEGEVTAESTAEFVDVVRQRWANADEQEIEPLSKMPPYSPESVAAGAAVFQKRECFKCHGRDGRGGLAGGIEVGKDAWGFTDPAADLTSGMLHGGQRPLDVYRRIHSGINGSPMPGFKDALAAEPDTIWNLAHYVLHLADQRRREGQARQGKQPDAGTSSGEAPLEPPAESAAAPAALPSVEESPK